MRNIFPALVIALVLFTSCRPDIEPTGWDVDALAPIASSRIDISDLRSDSTLVTDPDGALRLVYRRQIAKYSAGEIAPPFDEIFTNTVRLQEIKLGRRVIREDVSLGQVAAQGGIVGSVIIASHGSSRPIPPFSGIGPTVFDVDATEFFQSMTLRDGWLVLRIRNGFPIDLSNLQYEIANKGGSANVILQNTINTLPSGATHYDSLRLQNNIVIQGELEATLINLDSPGSGGDSVAIDTSDALELQVSIDKLDPVAATAIFPSQNLAQDTATANIKAPSANLTSVHVQKGTIFMEATSTIEDAISLDYLIPGAVRNGNSLGFSETVPPAPPGGSQSHRAEVPVEGYDLDLTSLPDTNAFNEFYTVFFGRVDSSGRLISLSLQDSVFIETGIEDLVANRGYGFMGYDTTEVVQRTPVEFLPEIRSGDVALQDVNLELEIENYIGADIEFILRGLRALRDGQQEALSWIGLGNPLTLERATEISPGQKPDPGRLTLGLDPSNSNISELFSLRPDTFEVNLRAEMNKGASSNDLSQFLYTDYGLEAYINMDIPLTLSLRDVLLADTLRFDYDGIDPEGNLRGGAFKVDAHNFYPFEAAVELIFMDGERQALDTLRSADVIRPASTDADGRSIAEEQSMLEFPVSGSMLSTFQESRFVLLEVRFNTPEALSSVRLYSDNYLDLKLIGDLKIAQ